MKETTIHALLQLLALIANVSEGKISSKAEKIIRDILKRVVRTEKLNDYLNEFRGLVLRNHKINIRKESAPSDRKKRSTQSVKALVICEKSNEVLQQHEKIRIISRLIEFANEDGHISEKEKEFLKIVKETFNIDDAEYNDIISLILNPWIQGVRKSRLILIDGNEQWKESTTKHLLWKGLHGQIIALFIKSCNIYMIKYLGEEILHKNARAMIPGSVEFLDLNSFIRSKRIAPIYYSTLHSRFLQDQIKKNLEYIVDKVEYKFRNSNNGVQPFSMFAASGELIGIMGGSGVGKSTLLNLMNGNLAPLNGHIYINGLDLHLYREELEGIIGYIPQDDLLVEDLTVFQNLYFNSRLCFGNYSKIRLLKAIIKILKELDLYEIRHLKVGSSLDKYISGGQRKRLNIGLELIREPSILFVDEPTSGLSSMDAESVMLLLKRQSIHGKIVMVNIHQPSSYIYKLFNKIIVMDKGGYLAYQGDPLEALVYFKRVNEQLNAEESQCETCGNVNPEQILEIVEAKFVNVHGRLTGIRRYRPETWYEKYKKNFDENGKIRIRHLPLPEINFKIPDKWHQFLIYTQRDIRAKLVNHQYLLITFLEGPLLAFIIGYFTKYFSGTLENPDAYVFSQNANLVSYLFISVVVSLFLGMIVSAEEIIKDALILKRESFLHLSRFSYLNSKILIVFFISAIQMISYILVGNYMLEIKGMTLAYWLILFSAAATANLVGLNISAALKSVASIYIVIPLILVPMILFSGTVVPFDRLRSFNKHSAYVPVVGDLMTSRWAFEALAVYQFRNNRFEKNFFREEMIISQATYKTAFLFPRMKNMLDEAVWSIKNKEGSKNVLNNLDIIRKEINALGEESGVSFNRPLWMLKPEFFNQEVEKDVVAYLDTLAIIYLTKSSVAEREKDKKYGRMEKNPGGKDALLKFQQSYANESIADLVLNRNTLHKILVTREGFIQLMDPVFKIPTSKMGRAHMYAPVKRLGGISINTFLFNLLVIWFTVALAAIVLYFDLLKKAMVSFESFRIRRIDVRVQKLRARIEK